jgi:hypothetical protein
MHSQPSERAAVVGKIDPALRDDTTANTGAIDMSKFHEVMFILQVGATDITVDAKLQEDSDSGFGSASDISGKAIGQASATDDNKVWIINLKSDELTPSKRYARMLITVGDGTSGAYTSAVALGMRPRFGPASDDDLATVDEIVT